MDEKPYEYTDLVHFTNSADDKPRHFLTSNSDSDSDVGGTPRKAEEKDSWGILTHSSDDVTTMGSDDVLSRPGAKRGPSGGSAAGAAGAKETPSDLLFVRPNKSPIPSTRPIAIVKGSVSGVGLASEKVTRVDDGHYGSYESSALDAGIYTGGGGTLYDFESPPTHSTKSGFAGRVLRPPEGITSTMLPPVFKEEITGRARTDSAEDHSFRPPMSSPAKPRSKGGLGGGYIPPPSPLSMYHQGSGPLHADDARGSGPPSPGGSDSDVDPPRGSVFSPKQSFFQPVPRPSPSYASGAPQATSYAVRRHSNSPTIIGLAAGPGLSQDGVTSKPPSLAAALSAAGVGAVPARPIFFDPASHLPEGFSRDDFWHLVRAKRIVPDALLSGGWGREQRQPRSEQHFSYRLLLSRKKGIMSATSYCLEFDPQCSGRGGGTSAVPTSSSRFGVSSLSGMFASPAGKGAGSASNVDPLYASLKMYARTTSTTAGIAPSWGGSGEEEKGAIGDDGSSSGGGGLWARYRMCISLEKSDFGKERMDRSRHYLGKVKGGGAVGCVLQDHGLNPGRLTIQGGQEENSEDDGCSYSATRREEVGLDGEDEEDVQERIRLSRLVGVRRELAAVYVGKGPSGSGGRATMEVALPKSGGIEKWQPRTKDKKLLENFRVVVDRGVQDSMFTDSIDVLGGWNDGGDWKVGGKDWFGREILPSVKNFKIWHHEVFKGGAEGSATEGTSPTLEMYKVEEDLWAVQGNGELSLLQIFGICLARFL